MQQVVHSEEEYSLDSEEDDTPAAYEDWKLRELERILHSEKIIDEKIQEQEKLAARRLMTEEERQEDDAKLDALQPEKLLKSKFTYGQKYAHGGAYFQDKKQSGEEALYRRDINEALDSEKYDKQLLPKPLQVKRGMLGIKGRVKHTDLKDADTTDFTSAWVDPKHREKNEKWKKIQEDQARLRADKISEMRQMGQR